MTKDSNSRKTWGDTVKIFDYSDREAWLKGRMKGIGGSDAAAVIGQNPYKSNTELFYEKTAQKNAEDISGKDCVIYGTKAEEPIRELFKLDYPEYSVEHHPYRIYQSEEHPFMQASLDGELTDQAGRHGILEIKTSEIMQASQWAKYTSLGVTKAIEIGYIAGARKKFGKRVLYDREAVDKYIETLPED